MSATRDQFEDGSTPQGDGYEQEQLNEMQRAFQSVHSVAQGSLTATKPLDYGGAVPKCRENVEALWLVADGGCDVKLKERLDEHFACCPACHAQYEAEVRIKELLSKKCKAGQCAPEGLKERLRLELRSVLDIAHPRQDG